MIPYGCMAIVTPQDLTPRQFELLGFIEKTVGEEHRMPSYREMASALGLSAVGSIQDLVNALVTKDYLKKDGRHVSLSKRRQSSIVQVPIVGVVAAGSLTEALENNLGVMAFSTQILNQKLVGKKTGTLFALRVQGESMIEAGIFEGDFVLVQAGAEVRTGDTVVARLKGEATVKDISFKGSGITLHPRNKTMKDIILNARESSEVEILGKVLVVQRVLA